MKQNLGSPPFSICPSIFVAMIMMKARAQGSPFGHPACSLLFFFGLTLTAPPNPMMQENKRIETPTCHRKKLAVAKIIKLNEEP